MVQRINISLPDELFERLEKTKSALNDSVSGVCQKAIESEVSRQELLLKGFEKMENVIERLKLEKEEYGKQFEEDGYKDGLDDAKDMKYGELVDLYHSHEICARESSFSDWDTRFVYKSLAWDSWLGDIIGDRESNYDIFDADAYLSGWFRGVVEFWDGIKGKV